MEYTQSQWILFFFFYCFLGWLWESGYVSVKKREWINRGFLRGPLLPIYGFGAISILWLTLPVREHLGLVFVIQIFQIMHNVLALKSAQGAAKILRCCHSRSSRCERSFFVL